MSDNSILNILGGANASMMEAGESLSAKGQANVEIESLDPELVAKLPEALKESLTTKKDLPTFESMLLGEEDEASVEAPVQNLIATKSVKGEEVVSASKPNIDVAPKTEAKSLNQDLVNALSKNNVKADQEVVANAKPVVKATGVSEVLNEVAVTDGELSETGEEVASEKIPFTTTSITTKKTNPNLKLVSGDDFISTKNAGKNTTKMSVEGEIAPEVKTGEQALEVVAREADQLATKSRATQMTNNPFMAQSAQLRGGLALNGAMFREALAADSSEGEEGGVDEKKADAKITGVEMKDLQVMDPALGLSSREQVNNAAPADKPVLNLSHIDARKTGDLIGEISNYIDRSRLESKGEIDVWVHHKDLGTFQVQAGKSTALGKDSVDLKIETFSKEGQNFFNQNAPELVKHLQDSGVKVSDFQIKTSSALHTLAQSSESSNSSMGREGNQHSNNGQSGSQQFAGQNQRQGSEQSGDRRRQMWQHYQETYRQRFAS